MAALRCALAGLKMANGELPRLLLAPLSESSNLERNGYKNWMAGVESTHGKNKIKTPRESDPGTR